MAIMDKIGGLHYVGLTLQESLVWGISQLPCCRRLAATTQGSNLPQQGNVHSHIHRRL